MLPPPKRIITYTPTVPAPQSFWERTKSVSVGAWDGLYKVADKVGAFSNEQTGKLGMEAFFPTSLDLESSKAARILRTFTLDASEMPQEALADSRKTQKVVRKIPPSAIENCFGLAIFTVCRTGFVISGAGGSGIVVAKLGDGSWSPPSGILLHTMGVGFMFGADIYDVVLILRTKSALESFQNPRVSIGGEISVAVGPYGTGAMLESSIDASPVWSYTKSKGLYGGVQIDGNVVIERVDENARAYSRPGIKAKDIFNGQASAPYWCEGLHQTILAAEGKPYNAKSIPSGPSSSEYDAPPELTGSSPRRLPQELEDDEDMAARLEMQSAMREFGIEDAGINSSNREMDEQMLSGEELHMLEMARREGAEMEEVPILSPGGGSSITSGSYPMSLEEDGEIEKIEIVGAAAPPPPLPHRRVESVRRVVPPVPTTTSNILPEAIPLPSTPTISEDESTIEKEEVVVKVEEKLEKVSEVVEKSVEEKVEIEKVEKKESVAEETSEEKKEE